MVVLEGVLRGKGKEKGGGDEACGRLRETGTWERSLCLDVWCKSSFGGLVQAFSVSLLGLQHRDGLLGGAQRGRVGRLL